MTDITDSTSTSYEPRRSKRRRESPYRLHYRTITGTTGSSRSTKSNSTASQSAFEKEALAKTIAASRQDQELDRKLKRKREHNTNTNIISQEESNDAANANDGDGDECSTLNGDCDTTTHTNVIEELVHQDAAPEALDHGRRINHHINQRKLQSRILKQKKKKMDNKNKKRTTTTSIAVAASPTSVVTHNDIPSSPLSPPGSGIIMSKRDIKWESRLTQLVQHQTIYGTWNVKRCHNAQLHEWVRFSLTGKKRRDVRRTPAQLSKLRAVGFPVEDLVFIDGWSGLLQPYD
jgi:hypothetical protein